MSAPPPPFPAPPESVWSLADPAGAVTFLHAVGTWSIELGDWLRSEPATLSPALRAMLLGLLEQRGDRPSGLRPFPRAAVADPSPESAVAALTWRRALLDYLADVWDVIGAPRFERAECAAATQSLLPPDAGDRCLSCLLRLTPTERPDHWHVCPARQLAGGPPSPFTPGQLGAPPPPPPGFNPPPPPSPE